MIDQNEFINTYITKLKAKVDELQGTVIILEAQLKVTQDALQKAIQVEESPAVDDMAKK